MLDRMRMAANLSKQISFNIISTRTYLVSDELFLLPKIEVKEVVTCNKYLVFDAEFLV